MKKLLFTNFLKDTLKFFILICFSIAAIVWVVQAVGYLDFVTEDGHGLYVYFSYTLLNFPKIVHRIMPFVFFISLFYQISQYELRNELLIFWTVGVNKLQFINSIILYSLLFAFFQIILGSYISPMSQNEARSYIRNSNIDFFPSLIKEGKFIDTVKNLTIFIDSKNEGMVYKNIFINETFDGNKKIKTPKSQMIYAKKGILKNIGNEKYLELNDGKIVNKNNKKINNFSFKKIDFDLTQYQSKTTSFPKIQELESKLLIKCLNFHIKNKKHELKNKYLRCNDGSIIHVKEELFKRFYKPIYLPLLALLTCLIILISKENEKYNLYKVLLFTIIILLIVTSEISLRYAAINIFGTLFFIFFPITLFLITYVYLVQKLRNNL